MFNMKNLKSLLSCNNRFAVITGATGNLGRVISKTLAEVGFNLILNDIELNKLIELENELNKKYNVKVYNFDCNLEKILTLIWLNITKIII